MKALFAGVLGYSSSTTTTNAFTANLSGTFWWLADARYPAPSRHTDRVPREERGMRTNGPSATGAARGLTVRGLRGFEALGALAPTLSPSERATVLDVGCPQRPRGARGLACSMGPTVGLLRERRSPFDGRLHSDSQDELGARCHRRPGATPARDLRQPGMEAQPVSADRIAFKPPIIDQLAKEAGIEPAALDLLRKHGITERCRLGPASASPMSLGYAR